MSPARKTRRPGESLNVTRIEHENLYSAVRENRRHIERLERKLDDLAADVADLKRRLRSHHTTS